MSEQKTQSAPAVRDNSWRAHMRNTLILGVPLIGAQLAQSAIGVTDTIMMGWLGATTLAGGVLATQMYFVVWIFGAGFALAIIPLAAAAQGADDDRGVRRSVRMGLWISFIYFCLALIPMWFAKDIMLALGQELVVVEIVEEYLRIAMWAILPQLLAFCLRSFLSVLELAKAILLSSIATATLNAILNYAFMFGNFGAPEMGARGAAVGTLLTQTIIFFALALYILKKRDAAKYEIFSRIWRSDWEAFSEIFRVGIPIGLAILAEVSLFIGASIMMGWIGTIPLAAHGIALGRKDWLGLERAGYSVLAIAMGIAFFAALVFWIFPEELVYLFLDENLADTAEVVAYAIPLVFVAAAFQLVDSAQAIATGVLRGMKDTKIPMLIAVFCYWLVGMPTAYIFAFTLGYGGVGLWFGLAFALFLASILLGGRFILRKKYGLIPH